MALNRWAIVGLWALMIVPGCLRAQVAGVRAGSAWNTGHDLVRLNELGGWLAPGGRSLVLEGDWRWGDAVKLHVPCAGLVPPGVDCTPRPTEFRVHMGVAQLGYRARVVRSARWNGWITPAAGVLWLRSCPAGQACNDGTFASLGLRTRVERMLGPVALGLGVSGTGAMRSPEQCSDCYFPSFSNGFWSLGVDGSVAFGRRR